MRLLAASALGEVRFCARHDLYRVLGLGLVLDFSGSELADFKQFLNDQLNKPLCSTSPCCGVIRISTGLGPLKLVLSTDQLRQFISLLDEAQRLRKMYSHEPPPKSAYSDSVPSNWPCTLEPVIQVQMYVDYLQLRYRAWELTVANNQFWPFLLELHHRIMTFMQKGTVSEKALLVLDTPLDNLRLLVYLQDASQLVNTLYLEAFQSPELLGLNESLYEKDQFFRLN